MRCPARFALLLVVAACGSPAPTATATAIPTAMPTSTSTSTATPNPTAFSGALTSARAARDRATNMLPPRYDGNGGKESVAAFVATPMRAWFTGKKAALEAADAAYADALVATTNADERVLALSEVAPLWSDFCDEMIRGTPIPLEWQSDPDRVRGYVDGITAAQAPIRERSRVHADRCVDEARAAKVDTPAARRCVELRARLQQR